MAESTGKTRNNKPSKPHIDLPRLTSWEWYLVQENPGADSTYYGRPNDSNAARKNYPTGWMTSMLVERLVSETLGRRPGTCATGF